MLFVLAMAFTGSNGWWYVSSFGVPWWDKPPSISGYAFSTALLGLTVVALIVAAWYHLREPFVAPRPERNGRMKALASAPLTLVAAGVVLFEVLSLLKGAVAQYPAYSIAQSNLSALRGDSCALANDVLVETDPNATMLSPLDGSVADALGAGTSTGFTPDGVAFDLTADAETSTTGGANTVDSEVGGTTTSTGAGTGGGRTGNQGVNGSTVRLPFGLDPATTPILGSYRTGVQQAAALESGWYVLPERTEDTPLLVVTAAGRVHSVDPDGVVTPGQDVQLEFGATVGWRSVAGRPGLPHRHRPVTVVAQPACAHRRHPRRRGRRPDRRRRRQPGSGPVGRRHAAAHAAPRHAERRSSVRTAPVLIDWSVGLAFPCQRPFDHRNGIAEVPEFRILPDRVGADATNAWQDDIGGGPLGWIPQLLAAETIPTYLNRRLAIATGVRSSGTRPIDPDATGAVIDTEEITRSGVWTSGTVRDGACLSCW